MRGSMNENDNGIHYQIVEGCKWWLHTSNVQQEKTFQVKTMKPMYTYSKICDDKLIRSIWLSKQYFDDFMINPQMKLI